MNGPDGKPTKLDDDFEPLVPALEGSFEKKFSELSAELQEWIKHDRRAAMLALMWDVSGPGRRRTLAQYRDWDTEQAVLRHEKAVLLQRAQAVGLDSWADDWDRGHRDPPAA